MSPDGEERFIGDIDVGEDATPEPTSSRTQQVIPDVSRDARLDVDLGLMTAQMWSQEQFREPVCKSAITLLQQGPSGTSPQDIVLQFPLRVRPTVQQAAVGQGVSEDNSHLVTKLSLNWTGPYKILVVGPGLEPDGRPVADKTLYLDLPTDMPGNDQNKWVSVDRCKCVIILAMILTSPSTYQQG